MAYSDFKSVEEIVNKFDLTVDETQNIFTAVQEAQASDTLTKTLKKGITLALTIRTEKARSEFIIAPILLDLYELSNNQISLFSGTEFNVDTEKGLNGICDFLISRSQEQLFIKAPVITIVEAKKDDVKDGLPQCISAMIAAQLFNERSQSGITTVYGVVTTGNLWQFLKLTDKTIFIDLEEYHVKDEVKKILWILVQMVK